MRRYYENGLIVPLAILITCGSQGLAMAGDLNPPAGPVAPTPKPLRELEPRIVINADNTPGDGDSLFVISKSGSYYLDRNLIGSDSFHGIKIAADAVTIDLNGFSMIGVPNSLAGIFVSGAHRSLAIRNGTVSNWVQRGLDLRLATHSSVASVTARGNAIDGISVGQNCTVASCAASANSATGISAAQHCLIRDCLADQNGAGGFLAESGCVMISCIASANTGHGFQCSPGANLESCAARSNTSDGVRFEGPAVFVGCEFVSNAGFGLVEVPSGSGASILNCNASDNGAVGIQSSGNVQSCSAFDNATSGFILFGGTIVNCAARHNGTDGITIQGSSVVSGNQCEVNGISSPQGAGIRVNSTDCRIFGNNLISNDFGIWVTVAGNLVYGNSASSNSNNFEAVANNRFGTIVAVPVSGVVSGNTGAVGFGTTDPWANFAY